MNKKISNILPFILTMIVTIIVVIIVCFALELELLFRCENYVTKHELNMENLVKFATIEQLEKRLKNEPTNYIVQIKLAKIYDELGKYSKSNMLFKDALKKSGNSNYALYSYAIFCAKRGLYALSSANVENITGKSQKSNRYRAEAYEAIADSMTNNKEYEAAVKGYQIAYKYAKTVNDSKYLKKVEYKYAISYVNQADYYIENNKVADAIASLNNSVKIQETQIALYKLALLYIDVDKAKAQKLIEKVFVKEPYLINPYIYNKLLKDLVNEATLANNQAALNYYSVKYSRFKKILSEVYLYKQDISIDGSQIYKEDNAYYLKFNLTNNTNNKIDQLYLDINVFLNMKRYRITKKIVYLSKTLSPFGQLSDFKIKLPSNIEFVDIDGYNYVILKYYAKKSVRAPSTLVKIESLNF